MLSNRETSIRKLEIEANMIYEILIGLRRLEKTSSVASEDSAMIDLMDRRLSSLRATLALIVMRGINGSENQS